MTNVEGDLSRKRINDIWLGLMPDSSLKESLKSGEKVSTCELWESVAQESRRPAHTSDKTKSLWEEVAAVGGDAEEADWFAWRRANPQGNPWEWVMRDKTNLREEDIQQSDREIARLLDGLGDDHEIHRQARFMLEKLSQYGERSYPIERGYGYNFRSQMEGMNKDLIMTYLEGLHSIRAAGRRRPE